MGTRLLTQSVNLQLAHLCYHIYAVQLIIPGADPLSDFITLFPHLATACVML